MRATGLEVDEISAALDPDRKVAWKVLFGRAAQAA